MAKQDAKQDAMQMHLGMHNTYCKLNMLENGSTSKTVFKKATMASMS